MVARTRLSATLYVPYIACHVTILICSLNGIQSVFICLYRALFIVLAFQINLSRGFRSCKLVLFSSRVTTQKTWVLNTNSVRTLQLAKIRSPCNWLILTLRMRDWKTVFLVDDLAVIGYWLHVCCSRKVLFVYNFAVRSSGAVPPVMQDSCAAKCI